MRTNASATVPAMARRATTKPRINTAAQKGQKHTQRERLIAGMITAANRDGYAQATVSAVIEHAGISRPTFYEYFADRDECFLAALSDVQELLLVEINQAIRGQAPERALETMIDALVGFASAQPARARFLMSESMAGGPRALDARDEGIDEIERIIEAAHAQVPTETIPDASPQGVTGGMYRLLAPRLRRGEPGLSALLGDLHGWVQSYERPPGENRWRSLQPAPAPVSSPFLAESPLRAPPGLPPGRPRLSEEQVAANHRQRILFAAAQLAEKKGYSATTTVDIAKLAGVDGRAFYAAFADKRDAFMAVHELGVQEAMAVTAGAFFAGSTWPERTWEAGRAFTGFLEQNPTIAHVGFVEAYAVGPAAVQRVEDSHTAFTIFLQEGYQYAPRADPPSRVVLEAIITTIFEIVYRQVRASSDPKLTGLLPHIVFLWLAPFLGAQEASVFVQEKATVG